ncbi:MAG: hypothetical protein IJD97_08905 [Clostridia bacterium]|nr:hypothetical protein [Clostridia bacterium]
MRKVLVCSIPCWNKKTGSDTLSTLFAGYESEKIANIYIQDGVPDSKVCVNYFHISESEVIKSIVNKRVHTGEKVEFTDEKSESNVASAINKYKGRARKRNYLLLLIREFLWKIGCWKSKELKCFLDEFNPEVVFFPMEGYIYFNRINRYILKYTKAKGIGYFWDDNFTYRQSGILGHRIYRFFQRRDLKKTVELCDDFFAIAPKTKKEADEFFNINCKILTKFIDFTDVKFNDVIINTPLKMIYTGKLIIGRLDTIRLIGEALDVINKDEVKIELDIYTATILDIKQLDDLSPYVHIMGAVPQTEVSKIQNNADILLFAEAIEGENSKVARLSFSTKLTDYFRSGKCILAVGNKETAPIEYLLHEDAALVATNVEEIIGILKLLVNDNNIVSSYAIKAYECGKRNHNKEINQKLLFETLNS